MWYIFTVAHSAIKDFGHTAHSWSESNAYQIFSVYVPSLAWYTVCVIVFLCLCQPKKTAKLKVRPPVGPRPCSGSFGSARHHRMFRVLPQIGHFSSTHLPPIGNQQQPAVSSPAAGTSRQPFASLSSPTSSSRAHPSSAASGIYMLQAEEPWDNPVPRKIRLPPKVSRLDMRGPKVMRDCVYPPVSLLSSPGVQDEVDLQSDRLTVTENSAVMEPPKAVPFNLPEPLSLDVSSQREQGLNSITLPEPNTATPLLSQAINTNWRLASQPDLHFAGDPLAPPHIPQHFEFTGSTMQPSPTHALLRTSNSPSLQVGSPSRTTSVCGLKVDKRSEVISKSEARDITKMANKATKEPLGTVSNAELLASLASSGGQEALAGPYSLGRLCATAAPLPNNIHLLQEDLLRRISPLQRTAGYTVSLQPWLLLLLFIDLPFYTADVHLISVQGETMFALTQYYMWMLSCKLMLLAERVSCHEKTLAAHYKAWFIRLGFSANENNAVTISRTLYNAKFCRNW